MTLLDQYNQTINLSLNQSIHPLIPQPAKQPTSQRVRQTAASYNATHLPAFLTNRRGYEKHSADIKSLTVDISYQWAVMSVGSDRLNKPTWYLGRKLSMECKKFLKVFQACFDGEMQEFLAGISHREGL